MRLSGLTLSNFKISFKQKNPAMHRGLQIASKFMKNVINIIPTLVYKAYYIKIIFLY